MALQSTDLFYVQRGDDGHKIEYSDLQSDLVGSIDIHDGVYVGSTTPTDPYEGDLWWNPDTEQLKIYVASLTEGIVTSLGVRSGGSNYSAASGVPTVNGHGDDLTVTLVVDSFNQIASATPTNGGHGYKVGDLINPVQSPGFGGSLQVTGVNSAPTGSWELVNVKGGAELSGTLFIKEIELLNKTAGNGLFDLAKSHFFRWTALSTTSLSGQFPAPLNARENMSGLIAIDNNTTIFAWDNSIKNPPDSLDDSKDYIIPYYIEPGGSMVLGSPVEVS